MKNTITILLILCFGFSFSQSEEISKYEQELSKYNYEWRVKISKELEDLKIMVKGLEDKKPKTTTVDVLKSLTENPLIPIGSVGSSQ